MGDGEFLSKTEEASLVALIRKIETRTTGEIRIHLTKKVSSRGVMSDATAAFFSLSMDRTQQRNGVLLYIATKDHELACIGDQGVHALIGDDGWKQIIAELQAHFVKGDRYFGLHRAVESIGGVLTSHFPGTGSPNELPDEISSN